MDLASFPLKYLPKGVKLIIAICTTVGLTSMGFTTNNKCGINTSQKPSKHLNWEGQEHRTDQ